MLLANSRLKFLRHVSILLHNHAHMRWDWKQKTSGSSPLNLMEETIDDTYNKITYAKVDTP